MKTKNTASIKELLSSFQPITLSEMDEVKLMNRTDTKYILHQNRLWSILSETKADYCIFYMAGNMSRSYLTEYFDTPDMEMYHHHHNGKLNRFKVRERMYMDTQEKFLEIKFKSNRNRTRKQRLRIIPDQQKSNLQAFIQQKSPYQLHQLTPSVKNQFTRITLVSKQLNERVTIDYDLEFITEKQRIQFPDLVIIEQKRSRDFRQTSFAQILLDERINSTGFSKYCTGVIFTNPWIKKNRFKPRMLMLDKLKVGPSVKDLV